MLEMLCYIYQTLLSHWSVFSKLSAVNTFHAKRYSRSNCFPQRQLLLFGFSMAVNQNLPKYQSNCTVSPWFSFPFNLPNVLLWTMDSIICICVSLSMVSFPIDHLLTRKLFCFWIIWFECSLLDLLYLSISAPMSSSHLTTEGSSATQLMCSTFSP